MNIEMLFTALLSLRIEYVLILLTAMVLTTWFVLARMRASQRERIAKRIGLPGTIIYADQGRFGSKFTSKEYRIVAKPDFIVRLDSGENAIVEFKNRKNGALYGSDIAQVKATALAVRAKMPIQKAYVLAGDRLHKVPLAAKNIALYLEIRDHIEHARLAAEGKIIPVFCKNIRQCNTCAQKSECQKPS